jgi:heat shock protein HslJ
MRVCQGLHKEIFVEAKFLFPCVMIDQPGSGKCIKNIAMQKNFIFILLAVTILSSFSKKQMWVTDSQNKAKREIMLDATKWWLTSIHTTDSFEQVSGKKAFIHFKIAREKANGNGCCNSFGGKVTVDGNKLSFGNIFSTKMLCDERQSIEEEFFRQLQRVTRYEIKGKKLKLFNADDAVLEFKI